MFVKIVRGKLNPGAQHIYEPMSFEFHRLSENEKKESSEGAEETLTLVYENGHVANLVLFEGDEVWLTSDTGQTADRWTM